MAGTAIEPAVAEALAHPYFAEPPPKSTGRELFSASWIDAFMASCRRHAPAAGASDLVATAVRLTAASIADAFRRFVPEPVTEVLLSGGGAENPALASDIARALSPVPVRQFAAEFFDGEAKEAVAFALLGWLFVGGRAGNVPTVTGARGPRVLGKLTPAGTAGG
jgi:anhydro-N-acetylmuramic acid kinase